MNNTATFKDAYKLLEREVKIYNDYIEGTKLGGYDQDVDKKLYTQIKAYRDFVGVLFDACISINFDLAGFMELTGGDLE